CSAVLAETAALDGAGVRFQRDFGVYGETGTAAHAIEQARDRSRREQARGAAAEKHAHEPAAGNGGQLRVQVAQQRVDVALFGQLFLERVRVEVAVRAFLHARSE